MDNYEGNSAMVIAYAFVAFCGAIVGSIVTYIFM